MATQSMEAQTVAFAAHTHREPSRTALATRSLRQAFEVTGRARDEAIRQHFEEFVRPVTGACPLHHTTQ